MVEITPLTIQPSVQFSCSVMSDSLRPHGLQHARPPCPSPTFGVYLNSCPLSWWCHLTISSSVIPFSSRLQSFPASGSFQMSQFFASSGQSIATLPQALLKTQTYLLLHSFLLIFLIFQTTVWNFFVHQGCDWWISSSENHSVMSNSATPWTLAHQATLSMGFSRQEYWSGCHSPLQVVFLTQGSNPGLLHCRQIHCRHTDGLVVSNILVVEIFFMWLSSSLSEETLKLTVIYSENLFSLYTDTVVRENRLAFSMEDLGKCIKRISLSTKSV